MWRLLLLGLFLVVCPSASWAQDQAWQSCQAEVGVAPPALHDCRPVQGTIDPQGRELWLRAVVQRPSGAGPTALYIVGTASSEVWLNGERLGANGRPGNTARLEVPGRYEAALPIPDRLWRASDNVVVVRMSSFHGAVRLDSPIAAIRVAAWPWPSRPLPLAITFVVAGLLFAAAFGFGLIHSLRRTPSSLMLAALAGVAGLQAILESLRTLVAYSYPVHGWRLIGIWGLTVVFAGLLVVWTASRFWPQMRRPLIAVVCISLAATFLAPGFDMKTVLALMIGVGVSTAVAGVGVYRRLAGARPTLVYLGAFMGVGMLFPTWLVDLSYFLFAAGLILPMLMLELVRLGRDDQRREAALTRAAARPDCLTVASSGGVQRVPLAEVLAVVGADDYVELRLTEGRHLLHAARLDRLEADLPKGFLRAHRSVIVNLAHVRGFERDGGRGRLLMTEGQPLPISRNRLPAVRDALDAVGLSPRSVS